MSFKFLKSIFAAGALVLAASYAFTTSAYSIEVNLNGFTGTINSSVSSGVSIRVGARDCSLVDGYAYAEADATGAAVIAGTLAARVAGGATTSASTNMTSYVSGSGGGCATYRTDDYGNTTSKFLDIGTNTGNDGNLNFDQGDVFSATQKIYSELVGTAAGGLGVRASFVGSVNPALELNAPGFRAFTAAAKDDFESDFTLLDAYVLHSDEIGNTYIDIQAGRFVTSWGEATFIPIGMNGLVTNALDLSKLRSPGASIREALMPTEQVSISLGFEDGSGLEVYTQFSHDRLGLDPSGAYFGNEVLGAGAKSLLATGSNYKERPKPAGCPYVMVGSAASAADGFSGGAGLACTQANAEAYSQHATNWSSYDTTSLVVAGFGEMGATEWATARVIAAAHEFTTGQDALTAAGFNGLADADSAGHVAMSASGAHVAVNTAMDNLASANYDMSATVDLYPSSSGMFKAVNDKSGQYGIRYTKYLDSVGSGLDLGLYYANYHSKVPYIQFSMPGNVFAGDALGAYLLAAADFAGSTGVSGDVAGSYQFTGTSTIHKALSNAALSSGLCSAIMKASLRSVTGGVFSTANNTMRDNLNVQTYFTDEFANGDRAHDASECYSMIATLSAGAGAAAEAAAAGTGTATEAATKSALLSALIGTGARLFAAVTPINMISYQGTFPEDLQAMGASFSTNVGPTTLQGEVTFRPNFPLATNAGDQIAQLNDKNGAHDALNFVSVAGADAAAATAALGSVGTGDFLAYVATAAEAAGVPEFMAYLGAYERSTLGNVWDANGAETTDLTSRYYSKAFIEYDVWTLDLGTTTSFPASHPITSGLGADSSVLLTELGIVHVVDLANATKGFVNRNGVSEGPQNGTTKCLGAVGTSLTALSGAAAAITNIGAGIVDALFGNGGYCEAQPGADNTAYTYRIIGAATYNNFNNSPWSLSPNFSLAHDFKGYAPSSIGGFVEDKMTLSVGASLSKGGTSLSASYVNYFDDELAQPEGDKDFLSLSISHAF